MKTDRDRAIEALRMYNEDAKGTSAYSEDAAELIAEEDRHNMTTFTIGQKITDLEIARQLPHGSVVISRHNHGAPVVVYETTFDDSYRGRFGIRKPFNPEGYLPLEVVYLPDERPADWVRVPRSLGGLIEGLLAEEYDGGDEFTRRRLEEATANSGWASIISKRRQFHTTRRILMGNPGPDQPGHVHEDCCK